MYWYKKENEDRVRFIADKDLKGQDPVSFFNQDKLIISWCHVINGVIDIFWKKDDGISILPACNGLADFLA